MTSYDFACNFVFEALFFRRGSDSLQAPPNQGANHPYRAREAKGRRGGQGNTRYLRFFNHEIHEQTWRGLPPTTHTDFTRTLHGLYTDNKSDGSDGSATLGLALKGT